MEKLTLKQAEVLDFIATMDDERGWPPTNQEIADQFGFSKAAAFCHIIALRKKGILKQFGGIVLEKQWRRVLKTIQGKHNDNIQKNKKRRDKEGTKEPTDTQQRAD